MKLKCRISGIEWQESIFPSDPNSDPLLSLHPVFSMDQKSLISMATSAIENPHETSMYLIGLAAFNHLDPVWQATVNAEVAAPMIASQFERLIKLAFVIPPARRAEFPAFRIDSSNCDFLGLIHWLDAIQSVFDEWKQSGKELELHRMLAKKESTLIALLNSRFSKKSHLIAHALAEWAAIAAEFPKDCFYLADGTTSTVAQYWKVLIKQAFIDDHLEFISMRVDPDDLADLIDYCEMNIPHGTTHAHILMSKLRSAADIVNEFMRPKIKQPMLVVETGTVADLLAETGDSPSFVKVAAEPVSEPKPRDFKSNAEYLRAKLRWQVQTVSNRNSIASEL